MFEKGTGGPLCMFFFPTTSPKYREINLQETKKKISVRSGSGQKITGQYRFGVPKTLPRRTLVESKEVGLQTKPIIFAGLHRSF